MQLPIIQLLNQINFGNRDGPPTHHSFKFCINNNIIIPNFAIPMQVDLGAGDPWHLDKNGSHPNEVVASMAAPQ